MDGMVDGSFISSPRWSFFLMKSLPRQVDTDRLELGRRKLGRDCGEFRRWGKKKKIKKLLRLEKLRHSGDNLRKLNEGRKKLRIECILKKNWGKASRRIFVWKEEYLFRYCTHWGSVYSKSWNKISSINWHDSRPNPSNHLLPLQLTRDNFEAKDLR